jgi:hypothetical protein
MRVKPTHLLFPLCYLSLGMLFAACEREPNDIFRPKDSLTAKQPVEGRGVTPLRQFVKDGDAVFFVGNSFLGWHDRPLPQWVAEIGEHLEPRIHIVTGSDIVFGNTPLAGFLEHHATQEALASRKYNIFVLQGEEYEAVDHHNEFIKGVRAFRDAASVAGARVVLFMTWEFRWRRFMNELAQSYDEAGTELGIPVIPVGLIYWDCGQHPFSNENRFWLTNGDLHQNEKGTLVNAYAVFEFLTGINPHGVDFTAPGNTNDPAMMKYFSDMAWARVRPRLAAYSRLN